MSDSPMSVQHGGTHYKGMAIEPFEITMANRYDGAIHSIVKYVARHRAKGGAEDLWKAHHITAIRQFQMQQWNAADSLQRIPMDRFIEANGIPESEALILRNVDFWSHSPHRVVSEVGAAAMIQGQLEKLIQQEYPT